MSWATAFLAAVVGYLLGSISFARLVARAVAPGQDISRLKVTVPGTAIHFEADAATASSVGYHVGRQYGCLTAILDVLKAALPALAFRLWQPDAPYYLLAAGMATVGHIWPVWHRFKGGRGLSPVTGGMLVLDWLGVLVTNVLGLAVGTVFKDALVGTGIYVVFMIPWVLLRGRGWAELAYVVAMAVIYWVSLWPDLREHRRLRREGNYQAYAAARKVQVETRLDGQMADALPTDEVVETIRSFLRRRRP
ncbi:MAG TPA: glycerol-3-phosphate acyltransferase [Anaerolineae bacterium]|nr:glycerol-3-phosphate acyltransferase [Anaerolineae bacterium]